MILFRQTVLTLGAAPPMNRWVKACFQPTDSSVGLLKSMKISMKIYSLIFCLMLPFGVCIGQNDLSIKAFLRNASAEETIRFQHKKVNYLNSLSYDLPFVEKLEFRTETNEFDFRKQEYLVRVTPNSLRNIKTQSQYQETVQYQTQMEAEAALGEALKARYDLLTDYIFLQDILVIKNKQKVLLKDKVTLLKRSIALPDFDVLELIDAEQKAQENMRDILDLENAIMTIERTIHKMENSNQAVKIEEEKLIKPADVKQFLQKADTDILPKHPELEAQSARMYSDMLEYEWESAKSKFSIGYVQAKYGYDPNDNFQKSFSLGVGFDIPLKSASRLDLNELQINILESESDYKNLKNNLESETFALYQNIQNLLIKYELVARQLKEGQAETVLQEYRKIAEASPKALVKLRENTLKIELILKELQYEIMQSYIEYLNASGLLFQRPFKNYLSRDFERF